MKPTLLETFRVLATFSPKRRSLEGAPWGAYVGWAIANGLAALAAYNLEYRLAGGDAPAWARDRLLAIYQGTANDNVMKMVNFKRLFGQLDGRRIIVLGGAAFAEALYPHIAFRPIIDISLLVSPDDIDGLVGFLSAAGFAAASNERSPGVNCSLTDGRTSIDIFGHLFGPSFEEEAYAMITRALPVHVYGPSLFRLTAEDALLCLCLEQARAGYDVPYISFVDFRELLTGSAASGTRRSEPLQTDAIWSRARALKLDRALYASCGIVAELFPETAVVARGLQPKLSYLLRQLLDHTLVAPLGRLGLSYQTRGAGRMRRVLAGAHSFSA